MEWLLVFECKNSKILFPFKNEVFILSFGLVNLDFVDLMMGHIVQDDGRAVVFFQGFQFDVFHYQPVDVADEKAPSGQFLMLRKLRIGFGHFGHFVKLVEAAIGVVRVAAAGEYDLDVFQSDVPYLGVFQPDDSAG